ncbi:MFS transporter- SP family- general alpha glucoside:H+ symporter [Apiospora aurea]|uniref:MFS transporter- SP family- general alpha glucoside:H+ symporter n=1 Tax=Apiospora aurea TaxID=335848 RepID=A0ABR1QEY1_9PEZI
MSRDRVPNVQLERTSRSGMMGDVPITTGDASRAADNEKNMTLKEALRVGKKGIMWAIVCASSTVMEGFDLALLGGFYAYPAFQRKFGNLYKIDPDGTKHYEVPAAWQTALSAGAQIGQIMGLCLSGMAAQRFGYKRTLITALLFVSVFIFIPFFAPSLEVLLVGEVLQGIPWGVFEAMPASYAAEVVPLAIRPYITTYSNLCWVLGQLLATGASVRATMGLAATHPHVHGLRPESPWYLEKKGLSDNTKLSLRRITNYNEQQIQDAYENIKHTVVIDRKCQGDSQTGSPKGNIKTALMEFPRCLKGQDRRRTEIACGTWMSQSLCGSSLMGFAPYFFQAAGLSAEAAFSLQLGGLGLGVMGTLLAWVFMSYIGRRRIYTMGLGALCALLLLMAILSFAAMDKAGVPWTVAALLAVYTFVYDSTVGPCCYSIVTEVPSVQRRAATVALARICYNLCGKQTRLPVTFEVIQGYGMLTFMIGIFSVVMNPLMLNPTSWGWGTKSTIFWTALCAMCLAWTYFRLPETKGRSFAELDLLFHQGTSARNFQRAIVNPFTTCVLDVGEPDGRVSAPSTPGSQEKETGGVSIPSTLGGQERVVAEHKA